MSAEKIDLFKQHKQEYRAKPEPCVIETGPVRYLAVSGSGAPGGPEFEAAIGALYSMAYTVKMTRKAEGRGDYVIGKLEGAYRFGETKEDSAWTLMIRTPEVVTEQDLADARSKLEERGKGAGVDGVLFKDHAPQRFVQALHVGPYDKEHETVARMQQYASDEGLEESGGEHHEIYLSDPRRVAPEKLKTILRLEIR